MVNKKCEIEICSYGKLIWLCASTYIILFLDSTEEIGLIKKIRSENSPTKMSQKSKMFIENATSSGKDRKLYTSLS